MKMSKEMQDIIERIEGLRKSVDFNKSQFSEIMEMKPQTYNNFIGAQNSKPNIHLIMGVLRRFENVDARWLLFGEGKGPKIVPIVPMVPVNEARKILDNHEERIKNIEATISSMGVGGRPQ